MARDLGDRARSDAAYMKQLQDDPVGTMLAAGLPPEAVIDILAEEGVEPDEVQGYLSLAPSATFGPSLLSGLGGRGGTLASDGCSATFSCLCASSGSGCCYTHSSSLGGSLDSRSTPLR